MIRGERNAAYPVAATYFKDGNTAREWAGQLAHAGNRIKEIWYVRERTKAEQEPESGGKEGA